MKIHTSARGIVFLVTALIPGTLSFAPFNLEEVHEVAKVPSIFKYIGPADPSQLIDFQVVLKSRDILGLEKVLYQVSDPSSPKYGQHLSKEEVDFFFQPTENSQASVITWLQSHGIHTESDGIILRFSATVAIANDILSADFAEYTDGYSKQRVVRTTSYSLPRHLRPMINHVHPSVAFPLARKQFQLHPRRDSLLRSQKIYQLTSECKALTPSCVETLYALPQSVNTSSESAHQLSVIGLGNTIPNPDDIAAFIELFKMDLMLTSNLSYTIQAMDSSAGDSSHSHHQTSPEADLDVEYTLSLAGAPIIYAANSDATVNAFLTTALALLNQSQIPSVLSISYGSNEDDVGPSMATSICHAFMALGARGVSVIVASGDGGVTGIQHDPSCFYYQPTFPATCPFVTSIGGTTISADNHEIAASLSSGGFSTFFPRPDYQNDVVSKFLSGIANNSSNSNMYNSTNRAFPDIAAVAQNLVLVENDVLIAGDGTSFAAPIVASIVSMINTHRINSNKSTLGFLNPALYANSSMFSDVIAGNNPGCGTNGFAAVEGWDPVTGLGSPNFENLMNVLG